MLKKEFDDRMGRTTLEEEYAEANSVYMDALDFDKDRFVKEWKKIEKNPLVKFLINKWRFWESRFYEEKSKRNNLLDLFERLDNLILQIKKGNS